MMPHGCESLDRRIAALENAVDLLQKLLAEVLRDVWDSHDSRIRALEVIVLGDSK